MLGGQSCTAFAGQINLQVLGAELPCDTCVKVDMHSTGRGGYACSALTLIPGRNLLLLLLLLLLLIYDTWIYLVWYILRRTIRCGDAVYAMLWLCGGIGLHDEHFLLYLLWYPLVQEASAVILSVFIHSLFPNFLSWAR